MDEFLPNVIKVEDIKAEAEDITIEEEDVPLPMFSDDPLAFTQQESSQKTVKREASADSTSPSSGMGSRKKRRKTNFTNLEMIVLMREVEKRKTILQGTLSMATTADTKRNAWVHVTAQVNKVGGERRLVADVRKKYNDFRSFVKKKVARIKNYQSQTGDGSPPPERLTPVEKIMAVTLEDTVVSNITNNQEAEDVSPEPDGGPREELVLRPSEEAMLNSGLLEWEAIEDTNSPHLLPTHLPTPTITTPAAPEEDSIDIKAGMPPHQPDNATEATSAPELSNNRKRQYYTIPEEKEVEVVDWFREHKFLYDKKMHTYRDRNRKDTAYTAKADELSVEISVLQKWLETMRTHYPKLVSTKSGQEAKQLTERDQWIKQTFSFLRPHIVRCPTRTSKKYVSKNTGSSQLAAQESQIQEEDNADDPMSQDPPRSSGGGSTVPTPEELRPSTSAQAREQELLERISHAEESSQELLDEWRTTQAKETDNGKVVRLFHQTLTATLEKVEDQNVYQYMAEALKLATGVMAYQNGAGPFPRVYFPETPAPQHHQHHNQPTTTYKTMLPPAAPSPHYHSQAPSASIRVPSAPSTPLRWRSRAPTLGQPEATLVQEGCLSDISPSLGHILAGSSCPIGDDVAASASAAVLTLDGQGTSVTSGTLGTAECISETRESFTGKVSPAKFLHPSTDIKTRATANDHPYAMRGKKEILSCPLCSHESHSSRHPVCCHSCRLLEETMDRMVDIQGLIRDQVYDAADSLRQIATSLKNTEHYFLKKQM